MVTYPHDIDTDILIFSDSCISSLKYIYGLTFADVDPYFMTCLVRDKVLTFEESQGILMLNQGVIRPRYDLMCHLFHSTLEQFLDFCLVLGGTGDIIQDVFKLNINDLKEQKRQCRLNLQ